MSIFIDIENFEQKQKQNITIEIIIFFMEYIIIYKSFYYLKPILVFIDYSEDNIYRFIFISLCYRIFDIS